MGKKYWIIGIVVLTLLIIGGVYIYSPQKTYSSQTYDECVQQILKDVQKYKPASEEPIGATRKDSEGITWKKVSNDNWETDAEKYNVGGSRTSWGNALIDEQIGGAKYIPENLSECDKYIFTNNTDMTNKFTEIVDQVIQEQSQKGVIISAKEVSVVNLAGKVQGLITLNCEKMSLESDRVIIESIANKLFEEYPDDFAKGSKRDSWVDIQGCSETGSSPNGINTYYHTTYWRISDGYFDFLI